MVATITINQNYPGSIGSLTGTPLDQLAQAAENDGYAVTLRNPSGFVIGPIEALGTTGLYTLLATNIVVTGSNLGSGSGYPTTGTINSIHIALPGSIYTGGIATANVLDITGLNLDVASNLLAIGQAFATGNTSALEAILDANSYHYTGSGGADSFVGGAQSDQMNGGAGADYMAGKGGDDFYFIDNVGDVVDESIAGSGGYDLVDATISINLANTNQFKGEIENLRLQGSANLDISGNAAANNMIGNAGNNVLDGKGGADYMAGNSGNDTYWVDNVGDHVVEANGQGTDNVQSYVSFNMGGSEIENLALRGPASINGTGNSIANIITGNSGNNIIDGMGGADTMSGAEGSDTYFVDNAGDRVIEANGQGIDTVNSIISFNMGGQELENLTLTGSANINGTGNSIANVINGNAGINTLIGLGGNDILDGKEGADTMQGGIGNDTFFVDNVGDKVIEVNGQGTDTVHSYVSFNMAGQELENLNLRGPASIDGSGNSIANVITGNSGANYLQGLGGNDTLIGAEGNDRLDGGAGNDTLRPGIGMDRMTGGAGDDIFLFDTAAGPANSDVINDFSNVSGNNDTFHLENAVFTHLAAGALNAANLVIGHAALDANDYLVYNPATGNLAYDADGCGAGGTVVIANLANHATLTAADFFVV